MDDSMRNQCIVEYRGNFPRPTRSRHELLRIERSIRMSIVAFINVGLKVALLRMVLEQFIHMGLAQTRERRVRLG